MSFFQINAKLLEKPQNNAFAWLFDTLLIVYNLRPMKITINGENRTLNEPISLKQLVSDLGLENKRLAIEVNQDIVPRGEYADTLLKENDKVEIVHAIGGG